MDDQRLWTLLSELAAQLDVEVRLDHLNAGEQYQVRGGVCRLGGRLVAFVDRRANQAGRNRQLGRALAGLGLDDIYVKPALREFLDSLSPGRGDME